MKIVVTNNEISQLKKILQLKSKRNECGLKTSIYSINPFYGKGVVTSFYFDGLLINTINVKLKKDISLKRKSSCTVLEFSILIEGEKIIRKSTKKEDIVLEKKESYLRVTHQTKEELTSYKNKPIKEVKFRMYDSFIQKHQLNTLLNDLKTASPQQLNKNLIQQLTPKMEEIVSELFKNIQKGLLKRLFLESKVLALLHQRLSFQTKETNNVLKKIYKVEAYIKANIHEQVPIQQLARKVLINQYVLKSEFKKIFGTTIFTYSNSLRMNQAKHLLSNTDKPINEIADMVGYKNPTHFTAAFKRNEKTTPRKYRRSFLIND